MSNDKSVTSTEERQEESPSFFSTVASFFSPSVAHAEEKAEEAEGESEAAAEEEEEAEPEDPAPEIREACAESKTCGAAKHHFEHCQERIAEGKTQFPGETCIEELFHLMHCVDECAAPKIFSKLK
ncbi:Non-heme 11 kDa protein of cytochrome bc1 complex [Atractiella rhizophila]|nr:Non-heme 11 kDa protein of cytochrome bc1 complex [Atractiella rhizophila]